MRFDEIDFEDEVLDGLYDMNFEEMTPVQEATIPVILEGSDLIACAQTGTGKTAAYTLPLLNKLLVEGNEDNVVKTLVVVPTRELAMQIDTQLQGFSYYMPVSTTVVYGGGDGRGWEQQKQGMLRGADVTLVTGETSLTPPPFVNTVHIKSAHDLFEAVTSRSEEQDIIIKAAAVADYRPAVVSDEKVKKSDGDLSLALERTEDTLSYLGAHKRPGQLLCGFAMETSQLEERARGKLERKNLDLIAANNLKVAGAGFGTDTNVITLIDKQQTRHLEQMSKEAAAMEILTVLRDMMK